MRFAALWMFAVVGLGCSSVSQRDINDLRAQHEREKGRLDAVRMEIARAEMQAALSREHAAFEQCRAGWAEVRAEVVTKQADCAKQAAEHNMCEANNSAHSANSSVVGCLLGIGAAAVTSGAGVPLALAGCGAGYVTGEATTDTCPTVACELDSLRLTTAALQRRGYAASPVCGGYLGVQVGDDALGATVQRVDPQGPAAVVGITTGDLIREVDGAPTLGLNGLFYVLHDKAPWQVVTIH